MIGLPARRDVLPHVSLFDLRSHRPGRAEAHPSGYLHAKKDPQPLQLRLELIFEGAIARRLPRDVSQLGC